MSRTINAYARLATMNAYARLAQGLLWLDKQEISSVRLRSDSTYALGIMTGKQDRALRFDQGSGSGTTIAIRIRSGQGYPQGSGPGFDQGSSFDQGSGSDQGSHRTLT